MPTTRPHRSCPSGATRHRATCPCAVCESGFPESTSPKGSLQRSRPACGRRSRRSRRTAAACTRWTCRTRAMAWRRTISSRPRKRRATWRASTACASAGVRGGANVSDGRRVGAPVTGARAQTAIVTFAESVRAVDAGPEHTAALSALFQRAGVPCYCRYWHFSGGSNAWLERCAASPEQNQGEMVAALEAGTPEMMGVVGLAAEQAVGWLKMTPSVAAPKLYAQRVYRALPCFDGSRQGVLAVGCVLVDPAWRRRSAAEAMLHHAIALARRWGARAIEAFPRRGEGLRDHEVWTGPFPLFAGAGFDVVHDFAPYPVLRLDL